MEASDLALTDPPPVQWVIEGVVARGHVTALFGSPGQGKSFVALSFAAGMAAGGVPIAGLRTRPGEVVVFDAENGRDEIHRRVRTMGIQSGVRIAEVSGGFDLEADLHHVADAVSPATIRLLVLDSFRSLWPNGDENSSEDVSRVLGKVQTLAREADVGVLLLHHLNKGGEFRGSGAVTAVPEIAVKMTGNPEDALNRRALTWEKCRIGEKPVRKWLVIRNGAVHESWSPKEDKERI